MGKKVFVLGVAGFPFGSARVEKLKFIGKSLRYLGIDVTFVSNAWGVYRKGELLHQGEHDGMKYIYSCGQTFRPDSFFARRWIKLKGQLNEIKYLLNNKCDAAIVSVVSGMFFELFKYWIISRFMGYKIYYPHHEEEEVSLKSGSFYKKINLWFFKKFGFKILDGVFPVSTFLENQIRDRNPDISLLRIPPMTDFDYFDKVRRNTVPRNDKYFLYCGSLAYYEVIEFIISSFELLDNDTYKLHLISFGCKIKEPVLKQRISLSPKAKLIMHFGYLEYEELVKQYIRASALLIPLRNTIQDIARFPHKVSEYTASRCPIITNNIGDIPFYFQNMDNAIIAGDYTNEAIAEMLMFVINNPDLAKNIGENGYQLGLKFFDYKLYGDPIIMTMRLD